MADTQLGLSGAFARVIAVMELASEPELVLILSLEDSAERVLIKALDNQQKMKSVK